MEGGPERGRVIATRRVLTAAGELILGSLGGRLCLCDWTGSRRHEENCRRIERGLGARFFEGSSDVIERAAWELEEFFAGRRREFDVEVELVGTEFQRRVWGELMGIGYGDRVTYGELARRVGNATGVRAVAGAIGRNGISIFVPCHRVVGSGGELTGYAGGLDSKRLLLEIEGGFFKLIGGDVR